MKKRTFFFFSFILITLFSFSVSRIVYLNVFLGADYQKQLEAKTNLTVLSYEAPRGRILDCNGKVIVDNIGIEAITYHKLDGITVKEEIEVAKSLAAIMNLELASRDELVSFYLKMNESEAKKLITEEEYRLFQERKLGQADLDQRKKERVTDEMLSSYDENMQEVIHIYYLMNSGYYYDVKLIQKEVTSEIYAKVLEQKLPGIAGEILWKRNYLYGDTLKSIVGTLSKGLPKEEKDLYLGVGYSYSDSVGVSFLEAQYENYLRGEKGIFKVEKDLSLTEITKVKQGSDLVLSIDIDLQLELEKTIREEILAVKKLANTEYFQESYAVITDPNTGAIKAMSGQRLLESKKEEIWQDVTTNIIHSSFTSGSVIKGASMTVGYLNNVIEENKKIRDACVKLYLVPEKCSWKSLGLVDDITALETSSNYYQFITAIGITGNKYTYNMKLNATEEHFNKYRDVFKSYGLGSLTGIDLPNEKVGITGNKISDDLLLNLAIGQYDTYTPIQLSQYMSTIATNGYKYAPSLMQEVRDLNGNVIATNPYTVMSHTGLDDYYYDRIKTGLNRVFTNGTANGYTKTGLNVAGKTGTSETFYDSNLDGIMDTKTISTTLAFFFPYEAPEYSMIIVSPHISHYDGRTDYQVNVNRRISKRITEYLYP